MSDMPKLIWAWCYGETDGYPSDFGEWQQPEPTDRERADHPSYAEYISRDAPELAALVDALRKSATRLDWCAGLIHADNARDKASEWADEARTALEAYEALK